MYHTKRKLGFILIKFYILFIDRSFGLLVMDNMGTQEFSVVLLCSLAVLSYASVKRQEPSSARHNEHVLSVSSWLQCATGAAIPQDDIFGDVK